MSSFVRNSNKIVAICVAFLVIAVMPLQAQELSPSHIAAAKKAISATNATTKLNDILPKSAAQLTGQLIGNRPDIEAEITNFVNESALEIAPRRGDLEKEVAKIYARVFTEDELLNINEFFVTDAGKKFLRELPLVVREIEKASRVWGTGVNRDLSQRVREKLKAAGLQ